ncbi:hypothetical protein INR49_007007 [Caranx melampygus]|nr:hypothetical protein INR49_007007 [Caranx melampygus]
MRAEDPRPSTWETNRCAEDSPELRRHSWSLSSVLVFFLFFLKQLRDEWIPLQGEISHVMKQTKVHRYRCTASESLNR